MPCINLMRLKQKALSQDTKGSTATNCSIILDFWFLFCFLSIVYMLICSSGVFLFSNIWGIIGCRIFGVSFVAWIWQDFGNSVLLQSLRLEIFCPNLFSSLLCRLLLLSEEILQVLGYSEKSIKVVMYI